MVAADTAATRRQGRRHQLLTAPPSLTPAQADRLAAPRQQGTRERLTHRGVSGNGRGRAPEMDRRVMTMRSAADEVA